MQLSKIFVYVSVSLGILFISKTVKSQSAVSYQISDEQNLPSNEVYRVLQDTFGYLWIGCDAGLYKYDGFNYQQYTNSKINGKAVSFLQIDAKQRIWAKNFYGQIYHTQADSLVLVKHLNTSNPSYPQFTIDDSCNLWYYRNNYIMVYYETINKTDSFKIPISGGTEIISLKYFNGNIYVISNMLLVHEFNIKSKKINQFKVPGIDSEKISSCFFAVRQDTLLFLMEYRENEKYILFGLYENKIEKLSDIKGLVQNQRVYSVYSMLDNFWITTSSGAYLVKNIRSINLMDESIFLKNEKISSVLMCRESMLWFSSVQNGLFIVPEPLIKQKLINENVVNEQNITSLLAYNKNSLFVGAYSGKVYNINLNSMELQEISPDKNIRFITVKKILKSENFTFISRGQLCIIDNKTNKQYFAGISNLRDFALVGDTLYMVLPERIVKESVSKMIERKGDFKNVLPHGGKAIEYDSINQIFYIAYANGTLIYKSGKPVKELFYNNQKVYCNSISYSNGKMWLATLTMGVLAFENNLPVFQFNISEKSHQNFARTIKATSKYVWFNSEKYLYRLSLTDYSVETFDKAKSVSPKDINEIDAIDGQIFLGTKKGLLFFPEDFAGNPSVKPNLEITSVFLNNRPVFSTELKNIPFNHSNLQIYLASPSFKLRGNYNYRYRIGEIDSNWTLVPANVGYIFFQRVPPGKYLIEIQSVIGKNMYSKTLKLPIRIKAPFWQVWWFYLVLTVVGSIAVTIAYFSRIRILRKRAELKSQVFASQLTALKAQMNPHFLFNTLNSVQDLVLKNDVKSSNYYISKFSTLMRKILEVSDKPYVSLQTEIEIIDAYLNLEKLRFGSDFLYEIQFPDNLAIESILIPPMIIQPFIENAVKHGLLHKKGEKRLLVIFEYTTILKCIIEDNGVGRKRMSEIQNRNNHSHKSFATGAIEKRLDLLNVYLKQHYSFDIIDLYDGDTAKGTKVIINFPVYNS